MHTPKAMVPLYLTKVSEDELNEATVQNGPILLDHFIFSGWVLPALAQHSKGLAHLPRGERNRVLMRRFPGPLLGSTLHGFLCDDHFTSKGSWSMPGAHGDFVGAGGAAGAFKAVPLRGGRQL